MKVAAEAVQAIVLSRSDNGGGVVEIPMLSVGTIDGSKTSGSDGVFEVTLKVLQEIVKNFAAYGRPVPIGVSPHVDFSDRSGASPGFVESVSVRGETLYGQISLGGMLMHEFLEGMWRGWSVEMVKDPELATGPMSGWVLTGGIFTNRPATPVNFRIAAEGEETLTGTERHVIQLRCTPPGTGEKTMPDIDPKVGALEAKVQTLEVTRTSLEATCNGLRQEVATLETRLTETTADLNAARADSSTAKTEQQRADARAAELEQKNGRMEIELKQTRISLESEQQRTLGDRVKTAITTALEAGVAPATFDGWDKDPANWYKANFGGMAIDQFGKFVAGLPKLGDLSSTSSGGSNADVDDDDGKTKLSAEATKKLRKLGIDPKYATLNDVNELRALSADKE